MEKTLAYNVAGHGFTLTVPEKIYNSKLLSSYQPFIVEDGSQALFHLNAVIQELPQTGELVQLCNDESPYLWIFKDGQKYCFGFSFTTDAPSAVLFFDKDETDATIYLKPHIRFSEADSAISNAFMLMYAYNAGWHDTLLLHASAPMKDGVGYVFLGKSGTGKSTHSRMWQEAIPEVELLNDDNPVVRVIDGKVMLYGTPWSGKTPCYKNKRVPLHGIVRIVRAPHNKAVRLNVLESYASLISACSSMKWDRKWIDAQHKTIEKVITGVKSWNMECLPDHDAAEVCHKAVSADLNE